MKCRLFFIILNLNYPQSQLIYYKEMNTALTGASKARTDGLPKEEIFDYDSVTVSYTIHDCSIEMKVVINDMDVSLFECIKRYAVRRQVAIKEEKTEQE